MKHLPKWRQELIQLMEEIENARKKTNETNN